MARILVVDDEAQIASLLERAFEKKGYDVTTTSDPEVGLRLLKEHPFDILITDLRMPVIDGIEMLRRSKAIRPSCEVVLMTAYATVATARLALKRGAVDYVTKPFSIQSELLPLVESVLSGTPEDSLSEQTPDDVRWSPAWRDGDDPFEGVVGESESMHTLLERAHRVARSDVPVLLRGESGTGKEVLANFIHRRSSRHDKPMVIVNCAALPDTLLESELFGSAKGAFTGAISDRIGFFEAANGGTIFLDEIGEVSPAFQPKLLRVLESGEFHRIGDAKHVIKVDTRIVAATNRNLEDAIENGGFRADLYYRLSVVPLVIPPLRSHMEDLPALLEHFLKRHKEKRRFSDEALRLMLGYDWPGNVREVANAVEHASVLSTSPLMQPIDLPAAIQSSVPPAAGSSRPHKDDDTLEGIEVRCILQAMEKTAYNRTRAARLLGVTRRTLGYRLEKYGLANEIERLRGELSEQPAPDDSKPEVPARTRVARVRSATRPFPNTRHS